MAQLQQQLTLTTAGSKQWFEIYKAIGLATEEQQKLNAELAAMRDWAGPIASLFGTISGELTKTSGGLGYWIKQMSGILKQMSDFRIQASQYGGGTGMARALGTSALNLFRKTPVHALTTAAQTPEQKLSASVDSMTGSLRQMMNGLQQKFANELSTQSDKVVGKLNDFADNLDEASKRLADFASGGGISGEDAGGGIAPWGTEVPTITSTLPDTLGSSADSTTQSVDALAKAVDGLGDSADKSKDKTQSTGEKFGEFAKNVQAWVGAISGLIKGLTGGQTAGGGAMSGGMAGLSFGANFGPIGAAIGGVGGAFG